MNWHNLIFSDQRRYRLSRHLLFWTVRLFFVMITKYINTVAFGDASMAWEKHLILSSASVLLEVFYCYAGIYWLLPKYLVKEKYIAFASWLLFISIPDIGLFTAILWLVFGMSTIDQYVNVSWGMAPVFFMSGGFPICILLIAYKMIKTWFQKEQEKVALLVGNSNAELLLLKAQIHPHFLFNTLNNIYSFTLDKLPMAGELVAKFSHILHYMTKECEQNVVPLDNEIKILTDYMSLEKIRYGNRLNLQVEIIGMRKAN